MPSVKIQSGLASSVRVNDYLVIAHGGIKISVNETQFFYPVSFSTQSIAELAFIPMQFFFDLGNDTDVDPFKADECAYGFDLLLIGSWFSKVFDDLQRNAEEKAVPL